YALYINDQLVHYSWLNPGDDSENALHYSNKPFNLTLSDLEGMLRTGKNTIDIFTCNGVYASNSQFAPSPTVDGGLDGCQNPSSFFNNWLLVNGGFAVWDPADKPVVKQYFISGDTDEQWPYGFQGRAAIPEPPFWSLLVVGLIG